MPASYHVIHEQWQWKHSASQIFEYPLSLISSRLKEQFQMPCKINSIVVEINIFLKSFLLEILSL